MMKNMKDFYKAKYRGSLFIVKAGGRVIDDAKARRGLLSDIQELTENGMKVLLVYGGGHAIDAALKEAGIEPRKDQGRRITGKREMKIIKGVMAGDLGYKIGADMADLGLNGLVLNALPGPWTIIHPRERKNPDDFGYDGFISDVDSDKIMQVFESVSFIATPCISAGKKDGININADNVATALAIGTHARKLIFLSDVDGVLVNDKTASCLSDEDITGLIDDGTVTGGMQVKLENCMGALSSGVRRIHLLNGFRKHALLSEIYESVGLATMVIREEDKQSYLNEIEAEKVIEGAVI